MDGYWVMGMDQAAREGDIFLTVTGNLHAIRGIISPHERWGYRANADFVWRSIWRPGIWRRSTVSAEYGRISIAGANGSCAGGRTAGQLGGRRGHPAMVMDMSFANQALACKWLLEQEGSLEKRVYDVPMQIDREIASRKLRSMGIVIDGLTPEHEEYLRSYRQGT